MSAGALIFLAVASLLVGGIASTGGYVLRGVLRSEWEEACRRRHADHLVRELAELRHPVSLGIDCLVVLCAVVFTVSLGSAVAFLTQTSAESSEVTRFLIFVVAAGLILIAGVVWVPAAFARATGVNYLLSTWGVWRAVSRILAPLVMAAQFVDRLVQSSAGRTAQSPTDATSTNGELGELAAEAEREGQLEHEAREMIAGVIQLGDAEVSQVMTPRTYMSSMRVSLPLDEAVRFAMSSGHTRIPVYDKSRDDIIGVLHMKDLLPELVKPAAQRAQNVAGMLRAVQFVPETKRLDELLQEFQRTRNHMALVLDEYGGVSGLVTLEDVLEEIVGEIVDEYDDEHIEEIKTIDERTAEALARARIEEVNERLGIHLPEEGEFDTIGGFVFSHLGHIPTVGESVIVDDVRLTVVDATRRRIERVRIEVLDPSPREMA